MATRYPRVFEILGDVPLEEAARAMGLDCIGGVLLRYGNDNITTLIQDSNRYPGRKFLIFSSHRAQYAEKAASLSLLKEVDLRTREPMDL